MNQIYQRKHYKVYQTDNGYIVHNCKMKDFAHSHIQNYKACLWIIDLLIHKKCPYNIPKYFVISLIRLTDDEKYLEKLNAILDKKSKKKDNYYNRS